MCISEINIFVVDIYVYKWKKIFLSFKKWIFADFSLTLCIFFYTINMLFS